MPERAEILVELADLKVILDLAVDQMVFRQEEWLAFKRLANAVGQFARHEPCVHSVTEPDCPSCQARNLRLHRRPGGSVNVRVHRFCVDQFDDLSSSFDLPESARVVHVEWDREVVVVTTVEPWHSDEYVRFDDDGGASDVDR